MHSSPPGFLEKVSGAQERVVFCFVVRPLTLEQSLRTGPELKPSKVRRAYMFDSPPAGRLSDYACATYLMPSRNRN